jgi:hypothetical protein
MTSQKCNSMSWSFQASSWNLLTNVTKVLYQSHKHSKLVHDSSKPTCYVAHLKFMIVDFNLQQLHESFRPISWIFLHYVVLYSQILSSFRTLCLLILHWFLFVCVYLKASSLDVDFGRASRGEWLGEFYTRCTFFVKYSYIVHEINFLKLYIWVPNHEIGWKLKLN